MLNFSKLGMNRPAMCGIHETDMAICTAIRHATTCTIRQRATTRGGGGGWYTVTSPRCSIGKFSKQVIRRSLELFSNMYCINKLIGSLCNRYPARSLRAGRAVNSLAKRGI